MLQVVLEPHLFSCPIKSNCLHCLSFRSSVVWEQFYTFPFSFSFSFGERLSKYLSWKENEVRHVFMEWEFLLIGKSYDLIHIAIYSHWFVWFNIIQCYFTQLVVIGKAISWSLSFCMFFESVHAFLWWKKKACEDRLLRAN